MNDFEAYQKAAEAIGEMAPTAEEFSNHLIQFGKKMAELGKLQDQRLKEYYKFDTKKEL